MAVEDSDLAEISRRTLAHYEAEAESFWQGTRDHDVSQNIDALLAAIDAEAPFRMLDFGCGPGRDLLAFAERGHLPVGLDGTRAFVSMAARLAGVPVLHQDFLALELPEAEFDGVFANASLFHVPVRELPRVLGQLLQCLKPGAVDHGTACDIAGSGLANPSSLFSAIELARQLVTTKEGY